MPLRYKRSRPASSVVAGQRSTTRSSTASPPSTSLDPPQFEVGSSDQLYSSDDEETEDADVTNMEKGNPPPFPAFGTSSGAGASGARPSFQGASNMSNDEVLERMMSLLAQGILMERKRTRQVLQNP
ncbi:hypothetical protein JCGZ_05117 [Jatropha curcas]|uniref:Uncharacterized protein n=1 Tax=Jatropha curcas TaxID=180498 RepID=A0A067KRG1_JATCU|nr:hypothetical protein JCGZ_05117 [Jatropha curcas]